MASLVLVRCISINKWYQNGVRFGLNYILYHDIRCLHRNIELRVYIQFHNDGDIFKLYGLKTKYKISKLLVRDLLFTDDFELSTH